MRLDLGPRLHAFAHSLLRPSEAAQTERLYRSVTALAAEHGVTTQAGRDRFAERVARMLAGGFELPPAHAQRALVTALVRKRPVSAALR